MGLIYLGKDPDSVQGQSPTLYYDEERDTYVTIGSRSSWKRACCAPGSAMRRRCRASWDTYWQSAHCHPFLSE